jgi:hypothetical protein
MIFDEDSNGSPAIWLGENLEFELTQKSGVSI